LIKRCGRTIFRKKFFIDFEVPASESLGRALASRNQSRSILRKRLLRLIYCIACVLKSSRGDLFNIQEHQLFGTAIWNYLDGFIEASIYADKNNIYAV